MNCLQYLPEQSYGVLVMNGKWRSVEEVERPAKWIASHPTFAVRPVEMRVANVVRRMIEVTGSAHCNSFFLQSMRHLPRAPERKGARFVGLHEHLKPPGQDARQQAATESADAHELLCRTVHAVISVQYGDAAAWGANDQDQLIHMPAFSAPRPQIKKPGKPTLEREPHPRWPFSKLSFKHDTSRNAPQDTRSQETHLASIIDTRTYLHHIHGLCFSLRDRFSLLRCPAYSGWNRVSL